MSDNAQSDDDLTQACVKVTQQFEELIEELHTQYVKEKSDDTKQSSGCDRRGDDQ